MRILQKLFFSMETMFVLMMVFALAIAAATFIENDYGTESARAVVYHAAWFMALLAFLMVNLAANIIRFRLWRREKWMTLLFHGAFLIILAGTAMTRFAGYEGILHIREGESSNVVLTEKTYLTVRTAGEDSPVLQKPLLLNPITSNRFTVRHEGAGVQIRYVDYIQNAAKKIVEDPSGRPILELALSSNNTAESLILRYGGEGTFTGTSIGFGVSSTHIRIELEQERLMIESDSPVSIRRMQSGGAVLTGKKKVPLEPMTVYEADGIQLVLSDFKKTAAILAVPASRMAHSAEEEPDALVVDVDADGITKRLSLFGTSGVEGEFETAGKDSRLELSYGSRPVLLPFGLYLEDFEIGRYPGSRRPMSFASQVTVQDPEKGTDMPYRIYMNHILKYRGFRFFQASYDEDEMGSILSVSFDPGTPVVYAGFALFGACLILHLFYPMSRFRRLGRMLAGTGTAALFVIFAFSSSVRAEERNGFVPSSFQAREFSGLWVQDQGRIKPCHTLALEIVHDCLSDRLPDGVDRAQFLLGVLADPEGWAQVPLIPVLHPELKSMLGMEPGDTRVSLRQCFEPGKGYRLEQAASAARSKPPLERNEFEKELVKFDERMRVLHAFFRGDSFRFFPIPGDKARTWQTASAAESRGDPEPARLLSAYLESLDRTSPELNGRTAESLASIRRYQEMHGQGVIPHPEAARIEILYNEARVFQHLILFYALAGALLLGLVIVRSRSEAVEWILKIFAILILAGFVYQTAGMALRWAISGHAPWSNKYESMLYIAWATMLAGLVFSKKTPLIPAASALLASLVLAVAHMPWVDPHIGTLAPVLRSHWLIIHVSVITASYGFFGLSAVLAFLMLSILAAAGSKTRSELEPFVRAMTWKSERILIIGLVLINLGNLFGAVWANESWGRYWGWDPKETWTLVVILVYAAVAHFRLIRGLKSPFAFHVGTLLAFSTVMMTYFGVNFYLSGLHSYAQGDSLPVPLFVYIAVLIAACVILLASRNRSWGTEASGGAGVHSGKSEG